MIWHGYWGYMHRYGYLDRPVLIARVNTWTPSNILIDYIIADNMVFSLYREAYTGDTYFAVTDEYDRTLARVKVGRKYQSLQADDYGVWVLDRRGNDPLYFMLIDGRRGRPRRRQGCVEIWQYRPARRSQEKRWNAEHDDTRVLA